MSGLMMKEEFGGEAMFALSLSGAVYYLACALLFTLAGLICGYFIWRKGHMQMQDAEAEVNRTRNELEKLREDLKVEESGI